MRGGCHRGAVRRGAAPPAAAEAGERCGGRGAGGLDPGGSRLVWLVASARPWRLRQITCSQPGRQVRDVAVSRMG